MIPTHSGDEGDTVEVVLASGTAQDVVQAGEAAWSALRSCLGGDDVQAWTLAGLTHSLAEGAVKWEAIFRRDQSYEPPAGASEDEAQRLLADYERFWQAEPEGVPQGH
jgi:hypothetical protein